MGEVEWEMYLDESYFEMWAVRDKSDRDFESPRLFHFMEEEDAKAFLKLVSKSKCSIGSKE